MGACRNVNYINYSQKREMVVASLRRAAEDLSGEDASKSTRRN